MRKKLNILLISHNFWPENFPINAIIKNLSNKVNFTIIKTKPYKTGYVIVKKNVHRRKKYVQLYLL